MAADTFETILAETQEELAAMDSTLDVSQGPVYDWFLYPASAVVAEYAAISERLRKLYSPRFADLAREDEALAFSDKHGAGRDLGTAATGTQTFFTYSAPGAGVTLSVPEGTVVRRTTDGKGFRVLANTITLDGNNPSAYYNASRGWYAIAVPVEALGVGAEYDTPANLVSVLDSVDVEGFDGTVNLAAISGGLDAETASETVTRTEVALMGTDKGTHGGILRDVVGVDARILDASLVFFTETELFRRSSFRPAVDVYVLSNTTEEVTETFTATLGQTEYTLTNVPVSAVSSVLANGAAVDYGFTADPDRETSGSVRATDKITFPAANAGDAYEVTYTYHSIPKLVHDSLFADEYDDNNERVRLFNTDVLVRIPVDVPLEVSVTLILAANGSSATAEAEAEAAIRDYCTADGFVGYLNPTSLRDKLLSDVSDIANAVVTVFSRKSGSSLRNGLLEFTKIERPVFEADTDIEVTS